MRCLLGFADFGGNLIFDMAAKYFADEFNLTLTYNDEITGNFIKGYELEEFEIGKFFSAQNLTCTLNLFSLITGKFKLHKIKISGAILDFDNFVNALGKLKPSQIPFDQIEFNDSIFISQAGTFRIINTVLNTSDLIFNVNAFFNGVKFSGTGDLDLNNGNCAFERSEFYFDNAKIIATGGFVNGNIDLHALINGIEFKNLAMLFKNLNSDDYDGTANLNLELNGNIENPKLTGSIEYNGHKIYNVPIERINANFIYSQRFLQLNNIQASVLNIPVNGDMTITTGANSMFNINLKGTETNLNRLDKIFNIPVLKQVGGWFNSFSANLSGSLSSTSGLIHAQASEIFFMQKKLTNVIMQIKFSHSTTAQIDGKFNFDGVQGYIYGSVKNMLFNPELDLNLETGEINIGRVSDLLPDYEKHNPHEKVIATIKLTNKISAPTISISTQLINSQDI